ncbi:MAG: hypothetical protein ACREQK_13245 [Candidatus Binatia bacterium]
MDLKDSFVVTASEREIMLSTAHRCQNCRYFRDRNWTIVNVTGREPHKTPTGLKVLDFPLKVGKEWDQRLALRSIRDGQETLYFNQFKVEAYEEVTVKAGTFKAFRVSWLQTPAGSRSKGRAEYWWSPEVRGFIKRVVHTPEYWSYQLSDFELESYTIK